MNTKNTIYSTIKIGDQEYKVATTKNLKIMPLRERYEMSFIFEISSHQNEIVINVYKSRTDPDYNAEVIKQHLKQQYDIELGDNLIKMADMLYCIEDKDSEILVQFKLIGIL